MIIKKTVLLIALICPTIVAANTGKEHVFSNLVEDKEFTQALIEFENRVEVCTTLLKENKSPFPTTSWFSSLNDSDQKTVILYLSHSNSSNCSQSERERAQALLGNLTEEERNRVSHLLVDVEFPDTNNLNMVRVNELQKLYPEPFDLISVVKDLGLID
ncbi:hypothetical protein N9R79_01060 [Vibrio sp.]|nr:hypothetical protein [Vibrio sp.]